MRVVLERWKSKGYSSLAAERGDSAANEAVLAKDEKAWKAEDRMGYGGNSSTDVSF